MRVGLLRGPDTEYAPFSVFPPRNFCASFDKALHFSFPFPAYMHWLVGCTIASFSKGNVMCWSKARFEVCFAPTDTAFGFFTVLDVGF